MANMEQGDENFTLPDGLAVRDEEQYQREVVNLAGHIIAGDKPEVEFDRILRDSGSQDYANELASDAVLWVSRMALSDEIEITVVPVLAGRIQDFLVKAKFKIVL